MDNLLVDADGAWGALRRSVEGAAHAGPTEPSNGGVLCLEPLGTETARASVDPKFNRLVVFENGKDIRYSQSPRCYRGGETRMTLAAWYFGEWL